MMDGVIRQAVDEAVRFIPPGQVYAVSIDGHEFLILATGSGIRTGGRRPYLVACRSCSALVAEDTTTPYIAAHKHTEPTE